ncbi:MAG TPA: response regulator [Myxococcaceae bacterium]|nr:response regulator [Myxococcaceae bacterium]
MSDAIVSVLVIDDEQGMRDMLSYLLTQEGFQVTTAESGAAAVEAARVQKFDLAITDLRMPGIDGMDTVSALKAIDPEIEVVVGTGYASVETAVECMKRGAYDYIRKPYDIRELKLLLDRALEKSRLHGAVELYEASRALLGTLDHSDLVERIGELALKLLRADAVGLVLSPGGVQDVYRTSRAPSASTELLAALSEQALRTRAPFRILSTRSEELPKVVGDEMFSTALVCPLVTREATIGSLVLVRRHRAPPFKMSDVNRATIFATQSTLALMNARMYGQLLQRVATTAPGLLQEDPETPPLPVDGVKALVQEIDQGLSSARAEMQTLVSQNDATDFSPAIDMLQRLGERVAQLKAALPTR